MEREKILIDFIFNNFLSIWAHSVKPLDSFPGFSSFMSFVVILPSSVMCLILKYIFKDVMFDFRRLGRYT